MTLYCSALEGFSTEEKKYTLRKLILLASSCSTEFVTISISFAIIKHVKIPIPKERIAKSKISEALSNFYFDQGKMKVYNDVSFELKNDSTLLFILDDNKGYWPDTAFMKRRDRFNDQFSYEENELMYRE